MITFFVPGIPQPGGSKRGFFIPKMKRVVIVDANDKKVKPWRQSVIVAAVEVFKGEPLTGPLRLDVTFFMPRPKSHYGTGKRANELKPCAPQFPITKPDRTKLLRALEDALTGIVWKDDTQIVEGEIVKKYDSKPGAQVRITPLLA